MRFSEHPPPLEAEHLIECLWSFQANGFDSNEHIIVPDGAVSLTLIWLPNGQWFTSVTGPSLTAHRSTLVPNARYAGIRLRPGVAGSVLHCDITLLRDTFGPVDSKPRVLKRLDELAGPDASDPLEVIQRAAPAIPSLSGPVDQVVVEVANRIVSSDGSASLSKIIETTGVSARQVRRRFRYQCGLTPKELARLRRVRATCITLVSRQQRLADVAAARGFADQAHMSREFASVFGDSTRSVDQYLNQIEHGALRN